MKNYKKSFESLFDQIETELTTSLKKHETKNVLPMTEALLKLHEQFSGMSDPEQEWPEDVSPDNPEEEDQEQKRKREETGGFYSR